MNNAAHCSNYAKWEYREYKVNIYSAYYGKVWYGVVVQVLCSVW